MSAKNSVNRQIKSRELNFSASLWKLFIPSFPPSSQATDSLSSQPQVFHKMLSLFGQWDPYNVPPTGHPRLPLNVQIPMYHFWMNCPVSRPPQASHISMALYGMKNISQSEDVQGKNHSHTNTVVENWPCWPSVTQPMYPHPKKPPLCNNKAALEPGSALDV